MKERPSFRVNRIPPFLVSGVGSFRVSLILTLGGSTSGGTGWKKGGLKVSERAAWMLGCCPSETFHRWWKDERWMKQAEEGLSMPADYRAKLCGEAAASLQFQLLHYSPVFLSAVTGRKLSLWTNHWMLSRLLCETRRRTVTAALWVKSERGTASMSRRSESWEIIWALRFLWLTERTSLQSELRITSVL